MSGGSHKRPWLAAFLAIAVPGLGHVYLRSWFRALSWFWMVILSFVLFVPQELVDGITSFADAIALSATLPTEAEIALLVVITFSAADAYWQATRTTQHAVDHRCPHCGHELDDLDLDFCHWCTESLSRSESPPEGPTSR